MSLTNTHCAKCGSELTAFDTSAYCANCVIHNQDMDAATLDVSGVIRQLVGLPPHIDVMCAMEDGTMFYLKPGSIRDLEIDGAPTVYAFTVSTHTFV